MELTAGRFEPAVLSRQITWKPRVKVAQAKGALYLGLALIAIQAADGILTSVGVNRFGTSVEANPFLRSLMEEFGHIPTLASSKLFAIFVIVALMFLAKKLPWVRKAMGAVCCIYVFAAIIPWTYILFIKPFVS